MLWPSGLRLASHTQSKSPLGFALPMLWPLGLALTMLCGHTFPYQSQSQFFSRIIISRVDKFRSWFSFAAPIWLVRGCGRAECGGRILAVACWDCLWRVRTLWSINNRSARKSSSGVNLHNAHSRLSSVNPLCWQSCIRQFLCNTCVHGSTCISSFPISYWQTKQFAIASAAVSACDIATCALSKNKN
jgi:hypothetical protein